MSSQPRYQRTGHDGPRRTPATALAVVVDSDGASVTAAEVIDAELVDDGAQLALDPALIEAVLDSFLDERGRLVPARTAVPTTAADHDPAAQRRLERAALLDQLRAAALAPATLAAYGSHVRAWRAWCRAEAVPPLPLDPQLVADHLLDYALAWDDEEHNYRRDVEGRLVSRVTMGTVDARLQALNKLAEFTGTRRPGDNQGVKEVVRGLRRRFGTATTGKAALDLSGLNSCLAAATGLTYLQARTRVACLLRARAHATAGQLASLSWADVDPADDGSSVTITLARTHRHGRPSTLALPRHRNPDLCLVRALDDLMRVAPRPLRLVLAHRSGRPLTRQALHLELRDVWDALPGMPDRDLAGRLATRTQAAPIATARDQAVLLTGFYTALRRSNLSMLDWGDVTDHGEDGLSLRIRRSKTDQEGHGSTSWVPVADPASRLACPAAALRRWREELTRALGRPLTDGDPLFTALTSSGTVQLRNRDRSARPVRLSGDGINELVQRMAVAAGLCTEVGGANPYGAHSLRSGFVTEATRDDKLSVLEVMEVTGHRSPHMVVRYRREANAPKRNAARKLVGILTARG